MAYVMRPTKYLTDYLNTVKKELNYTHPVVGVHIRRTDKLVQEANFFECSTYMNHVRDFYAKLELAQGHRNGTHGQVCSSFVLVNQKHENEHLPSRLLVGPGWP